MASLAVAGSSLATGVARSSAACAGNAGAQGRTQQGSRGAPCALLRSSNFTGSAINAPQKYTARNSRVVKSPVCKVSIGDVAPNFTLKDQDGRPVSLSKYKGRPVVVYFYPADDTPGCTKQACSFRDAYTEFKQAGAEVVGVSGDSPESHKKFAEKYNLPYTLLSDEGNQVRKEWGIPTDLFGLLPGRQTYVIDKKGVVQLVFNNQFGPEKHIPETLRIIEAQESSGGGLFSFLSK